MWRPTFSARGAKTSAASRGKACPRAADDDDISFLSPTSNFRTSLRNRQVDIHQDMLSPEKTMPRPVWPWQIVSSVSEPCFRSHQSHEAQWSTSPRYSKLSEWMVIRESVRELQNWLLKETAVGKEDAASRSSRLCRRTQVHGFAGPDLAILWKG